MSKRLERIRAEVHDEAARHSTGIAQSDKAYLYREIESLTVEIEQLRNLLNRCCEDDIEGPHIFGTNLWNELQEFWPEATPN